MTTAVGISLQSNLRTSARSAAFLASALNSLKSSSSFGTGTTFSVKDSDFFFSWIDI